MYASAMKFCGAMELCGIGYPTNQPIDHSWPEVESQMKAQNAGVLVAITRGHKPAEGEFMLDKGFAPVYTFKNPRTGTVATVWIKDFTGDGKEVTKLPDVLKVDVNHPPGLGGLVNRARTLTFANEVVDLPTAWLDTPRTFLYDAPVASTSLPTPVESDVPF